MRNSNCPLLWLSDSATVQITRRNNEKLIKYIKIIAAAMSKEQYFPTFGALWQKAESQACTLRARVRETLEEEVE